MSANLAAGDVTRACSAAVISFNSMLINYLPCQYDGVCVVSSACVFNGVSTYCDNSAVCSGRDNFL